MPDVTVVVPARDAAQTLGATLAGVAAQDRAGTVEVVVVDDASTDATAAIAEQAGATVVRHEVQRGPAASRNAGVERSTAPLIAFTDADCVPRPGWLAALVTAVEEGHELVRGPVGPSPGVAVGRLDRTLHVGERSPFFETANLAVTRALFERVGGFEAFAAAAGQPPRPARGLRPTVAEGHIGEDVLFGWRAVRLGASVGFAPRARVDHAVLARGPRAYVAERRRLRFFPALVAEVPELRGAFAGRIFLTRRSALFDLAVLGTLAALATRRTSPLALVLPYAADELRVASGPRHRAAAVAADAVGCAALVRGSLAARRVVL